MDAPAVVNQRTLNADQTDLLRVLGMLVAIVALAALASSGLLLAPRNLTNILQQNAVLLVIALGQFLVVLTGGIDLSIGAAAAFSSVVFIGFLDDGLAVAILAGIGSGLLVGLTNGILVTYARLPSFVTTLATMEIVYSLAKLTTGGGTIQSGFNGTAVPSSVSNLYSMQLLGVPYSVIVVLAIALLASFYLRSSLGHFIYAVGSNARAAYLAGIRVATVRIAAYAIASAIAAIGGILAASQIGYGDPQTGAWLPMDSIAAVSIGGASLTGGRGTLGSSLVGVLIIAILNNAMNLYGVPPTLQPAIKGLIIVLAVLFYSRRATA